MRKIREIDGNITIVTQQSVIYDDCLYLTCIIYNRPIYKKEIPFIHSLLYSTNDRAVHA